MKKQLLLGAFLLGSFLTANAQGTCATAVDVSAGGTFTSASVTGTYAGGCYGGTLNNQNPQGPLQANWYVYTPTSNGLLTLSSDLEINDGEINSDDTRISIFTGTCAALECYNGSDDVAGDNYLTAITVPVESGTAYYIAWDNNWSALGFDFTVTFEASSCLSPNTLGAEFSDLTATSAAFSWSAAIGDPENYDIQVGTEGFEPGTGDAFTSNTTMVSLTDLETTNNAALDVYVRSNCGDSQGEWVGPYSLLLAAELPYSNNFDTVADRANGFVTNWLITSNAAVGAQVAHSGDGFAFTNTSATAVSDAWLFARPIFVEAGETVDLSFFSRVASAGVVTATFDVTVGGSANPEDEQTVVESFSSAAETTFVERNASWTAEEDGVYYFAIHHNSPVSAVAASLVVDTFTFEGTTASTEEFASAAFSIFPNPSNSVVNVANAGNIDAINVVDINGRTVKSAKFNGATEAQVNISDLANGVYLMTIASDKGTATKKIVKN